MKYVKIKLFISNNNEWEENVLADYDLMIWEREISIHKKTEDFLKNSFYEVIFDEINKLNEISERIEKRENNNN